MDQLTRATRFAVRMGRTINLDELQTLWREVNDNIKYFDKGLYDWLCDIKEGNKIRLQPDVEPTWLTKEGMEWWKKNSSLPHQSTK